ncbi:MAG: hypothetical protein QOJ16_812 [Acidobacteriota bacterium]|jgi:hypothetical protein|nr:hypothetical protein [Acidobacteriota bacterium]
MSTSPLRRVLSASLLLAVLSLLPLASEARAARPGLGDSSGITTSGHQGLLERLWSALSHIWGADGSRIDPNGSIH